MPAILQGSLRHFPLRRLLPFLGEHQHGGTLELEGKGRRARIFLRDGFVIYGESRDASDLPALVAAFLDEAEEATFALAEKVELPASAVETRIAPGALLEEAERVLLMARTFPDDARFRVIEAPAVQQEIRLDPQQFKVLFRIGSGRSFSELMADGGATRDELAASLRALESIGLIARAAKEPEPPRAAETPASPEPAKKPAGALTSNEPQNPAVHPLTGDAYTIGREPGNDIVIADGSVSSKHARITRTAEGFAIEDLGSRNGTFVNGERVKEAVPLADNDTIRLGKLVFTFNLAAEMTPAETTRVRLSRP